MKIFGVLLVAALFLTRVNGAIPEVAISVIHVPPKDGTSIAVECAGTGPDLVIVHGGIGDRTRWKPLFSVACLALHRLCNGPSRPWRKW